jgi:hypothetical protein
MDVADGWELAQHAWRRLATRRGRPPEDDDELAALSDIGFVRRALDQTELDAVRTARRRGKSWAEIATHLGIARQSAWERWRDLDDSPSQGESQRSAESTTLEDAGADLVQMHAREQRRASTVKVPNVVGLEWSKARDVLAGKGLVAINANPDTPDAPAMPSSQGWIVTDQSPESGARVRVGSLIRLWLNGDGGAGVREPRRPQPSPLSAREMRPNPRDQAVG